jgi:AraC-like DNA-binding protein
MGVPHVYKEVNMNVHGGLTLTRHGHGRWPIDTVGEPALLILLAERGRAKLVGATGIELSGTDIVVYPARPAVLEVDPLSVVISARIPATRYDAEMARGGMVLRGEAGSAASVLRHVIVGLSSDTVASAGVPSPRVLPQIGAVLAAACVEHLSMRRHGNDQVFLEARRHIEARLADPELGQEQIAEALNVSTRTLYRAFHAHDTTVSEWIRSRRLEQCRTDLEDERLDHIPVSAIAARWGLADAAHFSRIFKSEFGVSPKCFRATASEALAGRGSFARSEDMLIAV